MRRVAIFDLRHADIALYESHEAEVLPLVSLHGGTLEVRLRALDGSSEIHVLVFPSADAYESYRANPRRIAAQDIWRACGATVTSFEVDSLL